MAIEVIIMASNGSAEVKGCRIGPVHLVMDDMTTLTTAVPCARRMLAKLNGSMKWAKMKEKPS